MLTLVPAEPQHPSILEKHPTLTHR